MSTGRREGLHGSGVLGVALLLGFTAGAVHLYSRGVFARDQVTDFGITRTELSVAFSLVTGAAALFAPVLGWLIDRYPMRRVMACGTLWLVLGLLLLTQVSSLWQFTLLSALFVATGTAAIGPAATTALMLRKFDRRRGLALGTAIAGYSASGIVMGPVAVRMLDHWGWRGSYVVFALFCLLLVPVVLLIRDRAPGSHPDATRREPWFRSFAMFLRDGAFWRGVLVSGWLSGIFIGLNVHLFLYLTDRGLAPMQAGRVLAVEGVAALVAKPLYGWLLDQIGAPRAVALAAVAGAVSLTLLPSVHDAPAAFAVGAALGLAFGGILPLQAGLIARLYAPDQYARAFGTLRLTAFPLSMAGSLVFGFAFDRFGSYAYGFYFAAALLVLMLPAALHPGAAGRVSAGLRP